MLYQKAFEKKITEIMGKLPDRNRLEEKIRSKIE